MIANAEREFKSARKHDADTEADVKRNVELMGVRRRKRTAKGHHTAAVCGQVAGAHYGEQGIPSRWPELLARRSEIIALADRLLRSNHEAV